jgi:hypothetical protein
MLACNTHHLLVSSRRAILNWIESEMFISLLEMLINLCTTIVATHWRLILFVLLLHRFHLLYWRILTRTNILRFLLLNLKRKHGYWLIIVLSQGEFNYHWWVKVFLSFQILSCVINIVNLRMVTLLAWGLTWDLIVFLDSNTILEARSALHRSTVNWIISLIVHILIGQRFLRHI